MITPEAVHFGQDDLPFVDIGDGSLLKVLQVKSRRGPVDHREYLPGRVRG